MTLLDFERISFFRRQANRGLRAVTAPLGNEATRRDRPGIRMALAKRLHAIANDIHHEEVRQTDGERVAARYKKHARQRCLVPRQMVNHQCGYRQLL